MEQSLKLSNLHSAFPSLWRRSVPLVMQAEISECGLACLSMVAGYFGKATDMRELRAQFAVSSQGANLRQLMQIADSLSLSTRAVKLDLDALAELSLPCILHWDMNHFVVLTRITNKHVVVHDPAMGKRKLSLSDFSDHFTGIALECLPTDAFEASKPKPALTLWHFIGSAVGLKRSVITLLILSIVLQAFALLSPYYMQLIVDDVLVTRNQDLLTALALGFALLLVIEVATHCFRQFLLLALTSKLNAQLSANVFHKLIRLPFGFFQKRHLGDVMSRFGSLGPIRQMLSKGLVSAVLDGLMAIITLVVMFVYDTKLALISLLVVLLYLLLKWLMYRPIHQLSAESLAAGAQENSHFMESVRAIKTIKLFEQENDRQNEWQHKLVNYLNCDISLNRWQISLDTTNKLLFGMEHLIVIYFAAQAVMSNDISIGMLYAFISYKSRFTGAMDSIINTVIDYRLLAVHFDRLSDLVLTPSESTPAESIATESCTMQTQSQQTDNCPILAAHKLGFRHSQHSPELFTHIDLNVFSGECITIVGPSGSGKTTLLHCLMGLLSASSGHVEFNGRDITRTGTFRRHIAAVMQDDHCLAGSIANNIACFDSQPDIQRVVWAAQLACIHDEIMAMPMQYQTLVGDMGSSLSGGQLQRVLIARALYRQPSILFMDEATAHLDTQTEKRVNANLNQTGIKRILVAHRPETIAMASKVYRLQNGVLQQQSTHMERENDH